MDLQPRRAFELSVIAHAVLLTLLYYFGSYQPELRAQEDEIASSLHATSVASTAKRLEDLESIKRLMEESADRGDGSEPNPETSAPPKTMEEMLERARELSEAIDTLDQEIRAEELAELLGEPKPPPAEPTPGEAPQPVEAAAMAANDDVATPSEESEDEAPLTDEVVAREVAALAAQARATLARRQERLAAKGDGVQVEGGMAGSGERGAKDKTSVFGEIANVIGTESNGQRLLSTSYIARDFFDGGARDIPPVDASTLVRGRGRMFGPGGEYANRVYLNSWYVIGPFPGRHGNDLFDNPSYPPEKAVLLDAVYFGKDKRLLKWRYVTRQSYPFVPPGLAEDSVYYGYTEVLLDEATDLTAWIGVDDDVQIYLNDQLVWKGGNISAKMPYFQAIFGDTNTYQQDYNRTEGQRVLHFRKGRNKLFFKMSNGASGGFLSIVLTR